MSLVSTYMMRRHQQLELEGGNMDAAGVPGGFRPGIYQHYKGARYLALFVARHSETGERMVVYVPLEPRAKDPARAEDFASHGAHDAPMLCVRPMHGPEGFFTPVLQKLPTAGGWEIERFRFLGPVTMTSPNREEWPSGSPTR